MAASTTTLGQIARVLGYSTDFHTQSLGFRGWIIDFLLLGSRLFACVWMVGAGLDKLPTPDWMIGQVERVGFPAPHFFAVCAEMSEYAGGVLLALGLLSRPAALMLAFTMGVAAFGFHRVNPILDYHITQGFFWLYIVFLAIGPGRFSLDYLLSRGLTRKEPQGEPIRKPLAYIVLASIISAPVIGYGLFREFTMTWTPPPEQSSISLDGVESLSIAGSFNEWDVNATPLAADDQGIWSTTIELTKGISELKFVANGSWDMNMGDQDQTLSTVPFEGTGDLDADNIRLYAPEPGQYRVALNTNGFTYSIEPDAQAPLPDTAALIGTWSVDLRPTPDAEPYLIDLVINEIADDSFTGTFYNGSTITSSRVTNNFGVVRFVFVTEDGSGLYHTSGEIFGDTITGMTHSIGRDFVMPWRGERKP